MATKTSFSFKGRNPDVLTCIANLSNDEVFTPPELANQMLDSLQETWAASNGGENIWTNPNVKFLDPFTKSGVFLREIVSRLVNGLADAIPDLQLRVDHVVTKQVYGIGVTELTSLLARRSVYCSKFANGEHSISKSALDANGNIWYKRTEHTWIGGSRGSLTMGSNGEEILQMIGSKCKFCSSAQSSLDRGDDSETHAYAFIHSDDIQARIKEIFGESMHFDVIIGNPPYQLNDGGGSGTSALPIYNKFVDNAKSLDPRLICMVIPARWFSGGKGLDEFRAEMLGDTRIRKIFDFPDSNEVFPGTQIKGGVCYFLWDRDNKGPVEVSTFEKGSLVSKMERNLLEDGSDVFIRYNEAISILNKVTKVESQASSHSISLPQEKRFENLVSTRRPFGDIEKQLHGQNSGDIKVFKVGGHDYVSRGIITAGLTLLDKHKIFIPFLASGSDSFPHPILGRPFIGLPGTATTETNLAIGPFNSLGEAESALSYISTRFFRFLVLLRKPSQNATKKVYGFVPVQSWDFDWTDEVLYKKYGLSDEETVFIEKLVRPMEIETK